MTELARFRDILWTRGERTFSLVSEELLRKLYEAAVDAHREHLQDDAADLLAIARDRAYAQGHADGRASALDELSSRIDDVFGEFVDTKRST